MLFMANALPKKGTTVTVLVSSDTGLAGTRRTVTGTVQTVSRTHGEFSIVVNGKAQWFGADEVVS